MGRCKQKTFNYCVDDATIQTTGNKKVKKIQHDTICKDASAECPRNKVITACTDTFEEHYLTHPEGRINGKIIQGDSNNQRKLLFKCSKRKHRDTEPELKHYMHTGDIGDIKIQKQNVKTHHNANAFSEDRKPSLHQKRKKNTTYPGQNCACLGKIIYSDTKAQTEGMIKKNKRTEITSNKHRMKGSIKDNKPENLKTDIKLELKPKHQGEKEIISNDKPGKKSKKTDNSKQNNKMSCLCPPTQDHMFAEGNFLHNTCAKGICEEASKKKKVDFVNNYEKTPFNCTDVTCHHLENITQSKNNMGVVNIRNKFSCLCRKYSQKFLSNKTLLPEYPMKPITDDGRNCTNETCDNRKEPKRVSLNSKLSQARTKRKTNFVNPSSCEPKCPRLCFKDIIKSKLRSRRTSKISENINTIPRNASDQTGEPFIEIKVDTVGMCVLNPDEIKNRVIDLSKDYTGKPTCICRSHKKRRTEYLDKNLCEGGICHKTFKDKKTNFKCKCERGGECTDYTCGGNNIHCLDQGEGCGCHSMPVKLKDPMFEVKLDSKRMCVLNSEEIQQKIIDIEKEAKDRADEDCPGGICGIARDEKRDRFKCKCIEKKRKPEEIAECSNDTCDEYGAQYPENTQSDLVCHWLSKLYKRGKYANKSKMTRKPINTNEVRNIKSIFSSVCDQIKSTPEIWMGSPHKRPKRQHQNHQHRNVRFNNSTRPNQPRKEGLTLNINKNHSDTCTCAACTAIPDRIVDQNLGLLHKYKSFLSCSFLGIRNRHKYTVNGTNGNFHRRNGLSLPPQRRRYTQYSPQTENVTQGTDVPEKSKEKVDDSKKNNLCACDTTCECADALEKEKEKAQEKERLMKRRRKPKNNKQNKLKKQQEDEKSKEYESADKEYQKKLDKKRRIEIKKRIKLYKQEQKEMKELSKQDEARDTNCLADFIIGVLKLAFIALKGILSVLYKVITNPEGSYRYTRQRLRDPKDTLDRLKRWAEDAWIHQKFRMNRAIKGSRTMTILTDEVKDSETYQAFAPKGKTEEERKFIEAGNKRRKKRILKRHNEALYGCRHMLLVTMRKTPCLWVYHICPEIYPQFLSARMFLINFSQMLLFCLAVVVWTPCIACCEACRGLLCCMLCTH